MQSDDPFKELLSATKIPIEYYRSIVDYATDATVTEPSKWEKMVENWHNIEDDYNIIQLEVEDALVSLESECLMQMGEKE